MTTASKHFKFFLLASLIVLPATLPATPINVAASANGGVASQSSDFQAIAFFGPQLAIDGNTDGYRWPNTGTIQHTNREIQPWWQVMFNAEYVIGSVTIYNRLDICCWDRINTFSVFLLDESANPIDTVASEQSFVLGQVTWTGAVANVAAHGLKVQLDATNDSANHYLHMAQVEVMGGAIPEPTTLVLMGAGLVGLGVLRRRR